MSYQNLQIWSQTGTVGLDLNQRPLSLKREKVKPPPSGTVSKIFPVFKAERMFSPTARPTVIGFLM